MSDIPDKKELQKKIDELSALVDLYKYNSTEIIWSANRAFEFTYINSNIITLTGYSAEECINRKIEEFLSPSSSRYINNYTIYLASQKKELKKTSGHKSEVELIKKDRKIVWAEIQINPKYNKNDELIGYEGSFYEITERKNIEEALNISYGLSYTVFDNIHAIVYVADMESYDVIFTNTHTQNIFGNILGKKCWQVLRENQNGPCELCPNKRLVDSNGNPKGIYEWEYHNNYNDRWYQAFDQAIKWIDGRIVRFEIAYDITDRKKDEKSLFKFLNQQKLFSNIAYGVNKVDSFNNRINKVLKMCGTQSNTSRAYIYELSKDSNYKVKYLWLSDKITKFEARDISSDLSKRITKVLVKKGLIRTNSSGISKEILDQFREFNTSSFLIVPIVLDEAIYGFIGYDDFEKRKWHELEINELRTVSNILSNAYKRKIVEEEVLESEKKLKIANDTKDKFFSIIAHDLKNPFNSILGFSELLMRNFKNYSEDKLLEIISLIHASSKNVYNLLENLLMWARTQTSRINFNPDFFNINNVVDENVVLALPLAEKKNITINTSFFYEGLIYCDYYMICTVLRNLITNAIKFTPVNGKISVSTKNAGNYAEVVIKDSGIGMNDEDMGKLFQINKAFSKEGTDGETGSGLGLILCKEFVEKNGGEIKAESKINNGSTFTFTIPSGNSR